jgi:ATP-binding cassette, subfamily B, bacterial MsbA
MSSFIFALMKGILEIYRYTFMYKWKAILVILYNLLFVIFNLISMILFIPFLKLIFNQGEIVSSAPKVPEWTGGLSGSINYMTQYYNYFMESMVQRDPKEALFFVCVSVMVAFFLKNLFRYGAIWHQSELRMAVVRDVRDKLFTKAIQLPLSYYSNERKGDLMSRMQSDVGEIESCSSQHAGIDLPRTNRYPNQCCCIALLESAINPIFFRLAST